MLTFIIHREFYHRVTETDTVGQSDLNNPIFITSSLLCDVSKIRYQGALIRIYTKKDYNEKKPQRFFFEPFVFLDPNTIISKFKGFYKQKCISFKIQMWNTQVRSMVLKHLRSLPNLSNAIIEEDDVCVMPYEEVKLVCIATASATHQFGSCVVRLLTADPQCVSYSIFYRIHLPLEISARTPSLC